MNFDNIKIPDYVEEEIFACICLNPENYEFGKIRTSTVPYHKWSDQGQEGYKGWKLLTSKKIHIKIPKIKLDPRGEMLKVLEAEKKKVQAEFTARINQINDRIQKLQAIEFKGDR